MPTTSPLSLWERVRVRVAIQKRIDYTKILSIACPLQYIVHKPRITPIYCDSISNYYRFIIEGVNFEI